MPAIIEPYQAIIPGQFGVELEGKDGLGLGKSGEEQYWRTRGIARFTNAEGDAVRGRD
jgi:hypothetical protein